MFTQRQAGERYFITMPYEFFALIIMIWGLTVDYKKDQGKHLRAKFYHFFMVGVLLFLHTGLIDNLVSFVLHFQSSMDGFSSPNGVLPGSISILVYGITLIFSLLVQVFNFALIFRKNYARLGNMYLLPFWLVVYVGHYFMGIEPGDSRGINEQVWNMLPGILLMGGVPIIYIFVYNRPFMKVFFEYQKTDDSSEVLN